MQLSVSEIMTGLHHRSIDVRECVFDWLEEQRQLSPDVTHTMISVIELHGWRQSLRFPFRFSNTTLDESAFQWVLSQLKRTDEAAPGLNLKTHLAGMIVGAPIPVIRPHVDSLLNNAAFCRIPDSTGRFHPRWSREARLRERVVISELSPLTCWTRLIDHCHNSADADSLDDADIQYGKMLVDHLATCGSDLATSVIQQLRSPDVSDKRAEEWFVGYLITLAGKMNLETAVPLIYRRFNEQRDWHNEEISDALARIGTPDTITFLAERYPREPWYVRLYSTGVFERLREPNSTETLLRLLDGENDDGLRVNLATALISQFDTCVIEVVKAVYDEQPEDPERGVLLEYLFAFSEIAGLDIPEARDWELRIAENWKAQQSSLFGPDSDDDF